MRRTSIVLLCSILALSLGSCTLHSTATTWNGRIGDRGQPVFVKVTTNIGFNLVIILPILGRVSIDEMIDTATEEIASEGGDRIRIFQTTNENYWYGFPPLTWILTPVITNISMEYQPSDEALQEAGWVQPEAERPPAAQDRPTDEDGDRVGPQEQKGR